MSESDRPPLVGIDVAILVGGLGTRLRDVVNEVPKPMAPVNGRPFLFYLLDMIARQGAKSVTLCCGYKSDYVREKVGGEWSGMPVRYSIEIAPLGTAGALAHAKENLQSDYCVVLNGDSWFQPDFSALLAATSEFDATVALARVDDASRFGTVQYEGLRIIRFVEKQPGCGLINAGVYCITRTLLRTLRPVPGSLERDVFPVLAEQGRLAGIESGSPFLDIGIPESYAAAGDFFRRIGIASTSDRAP